MIYLTDRQKQILQVLSDCPDGISIKELENRVSVSRRTIYREFKDLRSVLEAEGLEINNSNRKYSLLGDRVAQEKLRQVVKQVKSQQVMSVAERENAIAAKLLLEDEPCKIIQLALDLGVSEATIQNDLNAVEKSLKEYGIELLRKKGVGISTETSESERRQILIGILLSEINDYDFFRFVHNKKVNENFFLKLLDQDLLVKVDQALKESVFDKVDLDSDYQIMELLLSFTISIIRLQAQHPIESIKPAADSLKYQGYVFHFMALISENMKVNIQPNDAIYLANKILSCDHQQSFLYYDNDHKLMISIKVKNMVKSVSEAMHWNFQKNTNFVNRLTEHILSLTEHRVTPLPNAKIDMLMDLSERFPELYCVVKDAWQECFPQEKLTRPELQLLLLYFANEYTSSHNHPHLNALVICENGIGTSAILGARLKQKFAEINEVKLSRVSNIPNLDLQKYDLVLSTLELKGFSRDYLLVSPLLIDDEISHIERYIQDYERKYPIDSRKENQTHEVVKSHLVAKLNELSISSLFCNELVNDIKLQRLYYNADNLIAVVQECLAHTDKSIIKHQQPVAKKLLERIRLAPVGIPNSNLALLHTSTNEITRCSFTIFDLDNEIKLPAMDHNEIQVKRILLMLGPKDLSEPEREVMSLISSMIIMNDVNLHLFENGSQDEIKNAISSQYISDLKRKL